MEIDKFQEIIKEIVKQANALKNKHTEKKDVPVNYACIFCQNNEEYEDFLKTAQNIGKVIKETSSGFLFHINPIQTVSGALKLLKIRIPDSTRQESGDADFTISNFPEFEKRYLSQKGFKKMPKENFYMIELMDPEFNVRAYFSNPPLDQQLKIT